MTEYVPMPARKWLLRIGLPITILLAAAALLVVASWSALQPATAVRAVPVVIREIETDEPVDPTIDETTGSVVQAPGWVEADPYSVYAAALAEGVVKEVLVLEGDPVNRNQPVATLVDDDARLALERAEAFVQHLEADLAIKKVQLSKVPQKIAEATSNLMALQDEVKRKTTLLESGAVAAGPVERLKLKVEASEARIRQLRIEQQELEAHVMDAKALLAEGQAQRDEAQLRLDRMIVRSPMDGVVIERLTAPGSVVNFGNGDHGSHIVHLYDPRKLQVRADVPLAQAAQVGVGHPAEIIVDVLPGTTFTGEVTRFVHKADLQKNTVEAKVRINDPSDLLKPDMLARVRILQPKATDSAAGTRRISRVFVPRDSVNGNGEVMVIESLNDGRGTTQRRAVDIGTTEIDGWIEIRSGLSPGDRIVLDEIADGTLVRVEDE
ncbi:MAG: efflux RND transporter periplasmic adaptor subunit [Phycisphaerales bacterium]|nr:efflux RND transporter periplasmic adaptor subunit [Phycisphaerales bacterium]